MGQQIQLRSLIKELFSNDLLLELEMLTERHDINNNDKSKEILRLIRESGIEVESLGSGTNRYGVKIKGYAFKIALDRLGKIDNRREFKYSKKLYPDVIAVYEALPDGLIAVTEYITPFTERSEYLSYQDEMREILARICDKYLIGDIGVTDKNFMNWGYRYTDNGLQICCLDFAYIYSTSYNTFKCRCPDSSILVYDDDYNNLICPTCHRKYKFSEIRKRISKEDEEKEIGDIGELGYKLHSPIEMQERDYTKSPMKENHKKKKSVEVEESIPDGYIDIDDFDRLTLEEQMKLLNGGK